MIWSCFFFNYIIIIIIITILIIITLILRKGFTKPYAKICAAYTKISFIP